VEGVLHFFLPQHCVVCGTYVSQLLPFPLCEECQAKIVYFREAICLRCGRALPFPRALVCHHCRRFPFPFEYARAVAVYASPLREALHAFKYTGVISLAKFFGDLLVEYCEANPFLCQVDCILPVPLHPQREKERGFNQSLLLAQELSRVFHLPVLTRGVSRIKPTLPQTGLSMRERRRNVQGAFQVEDRKSVYRRDILIVDDVLTSRATVASLAQTLKRAGCGRVLVLALASGK